MASQLDFFRAKSTGRKSVWSQFQCFVKCKLFNDLSKSVIELLVERISSVWAAELMVSPLMERPNSLCGDGVEGSQGTSGCANETGHKANFYYRLPHLTQTIDLLLPYLLTVTNLSTLHKL